MPETTPSLLSAENLECNRDDRRLFDGLSFALGNGEVLQIEGPNGSGKTSFVGCAMRTGTHMQQSDTRLLVRTAHPTAKTSRWMRPPID